MRLHARQDGRKLRELDVAALVLKPVHAEPDDFRGNGTEPAEGRKGAFGKSRSGRRTRPAQGDLSGDRQRRQNREQRN